MAITTVLQAGAGEMLQEPHTPAAQFGGQLVSPGTFTTLEMRITWQRSPSQNGPFLPNE